MCMCKKVKIFLVVCVCVWIIRWHWWDLCNWNPTSRKQVYLTSDDIWRHRSGSTLAQVMACCLMAPSHYLNQCWYQIRIMIFCGIHLIAIYHRVPKLLFWGGAILPLLSPCTVINPILITYLLFWGGVTCGAGWMKAKLIGSLFLFL